MRSSEKKRRFVAAGAILVNLGVLAKVVALLLEGISFAQWSIPQRITSFVVPTLTALALASYLRMALRGSMSKAQEADVGVLLSSFAPAVSNLTAFLALPSFALTTTCWPLFLCFTIIRGTLVDLPPAHALVQLFVYMPFIMFLDFCKTCRLHHEQWQQHMHDEAAAAHALHGQQASLARYLALQGLPMALLGLAVTILSGLILGHAKLVTNGTAGATDAEARPQLSADQCSAAVQEELQPSCSPASPPPAAQPDLLPLESLDIHVLAALGLRQPLLAYERWFVRLAAAMDTDFMLRLLCFPTCCFYTGALAASRFGVQFASRVTPDEWLLVMIGCFLLGREVNKLDADLQAMVGHMQSNLSACRVLLVDLLPEHVVKRILSQSATAGSLLPPQQQQQQQEQQQQLAWDAAGAGADAETQLLDSFADAEEEQRCPASESELEADPASPHYTGEDLGLWPQSNESDAAVFPARGQQGPASDRPSRPSAPSSPSWANLFTHGLASESHSPSEGSACARGSQHAPFFDVSVAGLFKARRSRSIIRRATTYSGAGPVEPVSADSGAALKAHQLGLGFSSRPVNDVWTTSPKWLQPADVGDRHDSVTIYFSDICGFSTWANKLAPEKVMSTLHDLYCRLDDIILNEFTSLYKIETIGDAYVMAGNLMHPDADHAANAVRFALRAREEAAKVLRPDMDDGSTLQMRIGLHSGPVVSGIIGKVRRRFCLFGDTMNMAARTEGSCPPGCIQLTEATRALLQPDCHAADGGWLVLQERGEVEVKGSDLPLRMYLASEAL